MSAADQARYQAAAHAMQSGVLTEHLFGSQDGTPKHLRVGVNSAQVSVAAIAALLLERGLITRDDLERAMADEMEAEQQRYEQRLGVKLA